jgi:hypothetical protein
MMALVSSARTPVTAQERDHATGSQQTAFIIVPLAGHHLDRQPPDTTGHLEAAIDRCGAAQPTASSRNAAAINDIVIMPRFIHDHGLS